MPEGLLDGLMQVMVCGVSNFIFSVLASVTI